MHSSYFLAFMLTLAINVQCGGSYLLCAKCSSVSSPDVCNGRDICQEGCYASVTTSSGQTTYSAGCGNALHCFSGWLLNLKETQEQCCFSLMCNTELIKELKATATSPTSPRTSPTTPSPHFALKSGLNCHECSGGDCGLTEDDPVIHCPAAFPYCMNVIQNDVTGNKHVTKRCASFFECNGYREMLKNSPNHTLCEDYDAADMYTADFECSYCCETDFCNRNVVPSSETLLR